MFKIYVGNLDYKVKVEQLRELFNVYAPIEDLVIPTDPTTNRAKGFAIVMIRDAELGQAAVKAMQGKRLMGRTLVVNEAVKRKAAGQPIVTKADLIRNGPFGPRMNRFGDARGGSSAVGGRTSRNPRRGGIPVRSLGASAVSPTGGSSSAVPPRSGAASDAADTRTNSGTGPSSTRSPAVSSGTPSSPPAAANTGSAPPSTSSAAAPPARPATRAPAKPAAAPREAQALPVAVPIPPVPERPKAQRLATPKRAADSESQSSDRSQAG